jgi:hypothetical protein
MVESRIILLFSDFFPFTSFRKKLESSGLEFMTIPLSYFLSNHSSFQYDLLLVSDLFLDILEINLDVIVHHPYRFILITENNKQNNKKSTCESITIVDTIARDTEKNHLINLINNQVK